LQHRFQVWLFQLGLAPARKAAISLPFALHFACSASSSALSPAAVPGALSGWRLNAGRPAEAGLPKK
jgi:hypothetical protein